jgi:hypothetical protein
MIISHSHKFIFVHIHKTGGTSIEQGLDPHLAWNDLILGGSRLGERMQPFYAKKFGLGKHSTVSEIESVCGSKYLDDYYVFSLVRHPVARMCSMYNFVATTLDRWARQQKIDFADIANHITPEAAKKSPALKWASTKAFLKSQGFSEFIRHKDLTQAPGFRPQVAWLTGRSDGKLKAHFFRLEDYPAWLEQLSSRLGIEMTVIHANESRLKLANEAAISANDRAYVEETFRADYEMFGYAS